MHLHVLTQRAGVRVALVAAAHFARVGLVTRVHVRVLLAVAAVGEAPLAALELAPEGLLPWWRQRRDISARGLWPRLGLTTLPQFLCHFWEESHQKIQKRLSPAPQARHPLSPLRARPLSFLLHASPPPLLPPGPGGRGRSRRNKDSILVEFPSWKILIHSVCFPPDFLHLEPEAPLPGE